MSSIPHKPCCGDNRDLNPAKPFAPPFPPWIRRPLPSGGERRQVKDVLADLSLNTVCLSAQCPNQGECWSRGTATFMVLGNVCTRDCAFCGVSSGRPAPVDPDEARRVAEAVDRLHLRHAVITSVTRDDLDDGGAALMAAVVRAIHATCPGVSVETLTSDFGGADSALSLVAEARPEVFAHNIETVARLHQTLRDPRASYERSLSVLRLARTLLPRECHVKSGFMVGCGESEEEVGATLHDLREAGCDAVTIGQYLKPRGGRLAVARFVPPETFAAFEDQSRALGFTFVMSGPFVRSSYHAEAVLGGALRSCQTDVSKNGS